MIKNFHFIRKNKLLLGTFFIFFFVLISLIFIPNNNIDGKKYYNSTNDDLASIIQTSSNNPPNAPYFKYYKNITINHDIVFGSGSHKNFPFLISILDSDLHDHVNQSNGNDIAFANDTDWLDHEIEIFNQTYSSTHAQLVAWVRIPSLSTSINTTIYLHYGNATMTFQENPANVWSTYNSVWHLKERSGIGDYLKDSTTNNYNGTPSGTQYLSGGKIGGARNFVADSDGITISSGSSLLNGNSQFLFSFWIYPDYGSDLEWESVGEKNVFYKSSSVRMVRTWRYNWQNASKGLFQADIQFLSYGTIYPNVEIYRETWNYIVYSYDNNYFRAYVNGQQVSSEFIGSDSLISDSSTFILGSLVSDCFNGYIDEFRISSSVNTNGWYETEFKNQNNTESFITLSSEEIVDKTPPSYSNLIESSDPLELGDNEVIQINVTDFSGISQVLIEFEGSNHSMINLVGNSWYYDAWIPAIVGDYIYVIYMQDTQGNWNSTTDAIEVIDITPPTYSNLIESSDPLELGQTEVIQVSVNDFSGIFQVKIEFEGLNHSMTNIGGNIWQYNSWTPNNWIVYQYRIHMEDNNGNWKMIINNITVRDTIAPSPPILTNGPSGDVSGNIVFDWLDGSDPSAISYYILIIDNETDPSFTPGYIYKFNITNVGLESSYYELTDSLPSGKYYYFLAQIDGAGHQSSYTMGSFTINLNPTNNDFMIYVIIGVILASAVGSITIIVILRKKAHKQMGPPRKKLPFKLILAHFEKISSLKSTPDLKDRDNEIQIDNKNRALIDKLPEKADLGFDVDEIKSLGEELFAEGAYLEAIKQFQSAKEFLLKYNRYEEAILFSDLIAGIEGLFEEREKRLELLEYEKNSGDSTKIFDLYYDIIEISKKLRDTDGINMFQTDLIRFFQASKSKLPELEILRFNFEQQAASLLDNHLYKDAAKLYEKCENLSQFLENFRKEEIGNIRKFRNKKNECLQKLIDN